ncbi:MAG: SDR family NAD(P)-dependent oxidoreductase [Anaerolineales bacterium]|nr:SDR family NAD(P)-dependent oxidoreductase [Anaerolineales bacterium]
MPETQTMIPRATPLTPRKKAILVGASGGIGAALAYRLAQEGYVLALVDRSEDKLKALSDEINQTYRETRAVPYEHDVTVYDRIPDLFRKAVADLGGLDLFIYVAGVIYFPGMDEFNFTEDYKMVEVNLLGAMAWMSEVAPVFQSMRGGQIVGVSSVAGDRGRVGNPGYNTSKAGFTCYLEALRNRLTRHGVNVITVKPGMVKTEMLNLPNAPKPMLAVTPEQAAEGIWKAIKKRKQVAYVSGLWRWVMLVLTHIPSIIFRRLSF